MLDFINRKLTVSHLSHNGRKGEITNELFRNTIHL
jgi:hypothetical protein